MGITREEAKEMNGNTVKEELLFDIRDALERIADAIEIRKRDIEKTVKR